MNVFSEVVQIEESELFPLLKESISEIERSQNGYSRENYMDKVNENLLLSEQPQCVNSEARGTVQIWHPSQWSRRCTRSTRKTGSWWEATPFTVLLPVNAEPKSYKEASTGHNAII